jgi:hypothetical protein
MSTATLMPIAAGPFSPDAFTDSGDADGISCGLSHFINAGRSHKKFYTELARFDCYLSRKTNDPSIKKSHIFLSHDEYFRQKLTKKQRERVAKANEREVKGE